MSLWQNIQRWRTRRAVAHAKTLLARAGYNAASPSRLDNWVPATQAVNHLIAQASPILRNRVRDLVRNFPTFTRGVNGYTAFVVGRGARFQSLAEFPDGTPDHDLRQKIEKRFRLWMEYDADVSGKMHFYELQQLLCRQLMECGEGLFQEVNRRKFKTNPFSIMPVEPDRLTDLGSRPADDTSKVFAGIEYVRATGEILNYHVLDEGYAATTTVVPAEHMLHVFQTLRPGQLRGVTPFAPAIIFARAMADYTQAEVDTAKMAAKYLAMVTTPTPELFQQSRGLGLPGGNNPSEAPPVEDLDNAIIEYLRPGEEINFAQTPNRPGDSFDRFNAFVNRMVSISIDVPYEIISGNYTGVNYSTSKAARGDNAMLIAPHQHRMEYAFSRRVFHRWLEYEAITQDYLPDYWQNPERFTPHIFIPSGQPSVDPLRDGKADIDAVAAGYKSPQEVILSRGGDPEEVVRQLAEWNRLLELSGVTPAPVPGTALQNNPAALGASETAPVNNEVSNA